MLPRYPCACAPAHERTMTVIFTDLDGTLLDYDGYRWEPAADAVRLLAARRVPIVFCSSKTRAEQLLYQEALDLAEPFIVENGSAVAVPAGYYGPDLARALAEVEHGPRPRPRVRSADAHDIIELGLPVDEVRRRLRRIRDDTGLAFRGYADMTGVEVSERTGLDLEAARRATLREYSETIHADLDAEGWQRLREALAGRGLSCLRGRTGCTVISAATDKGRATSLLAALFRRGHGDVVTVGIGDSENDAPMLRAVDRAFLVQRPEGSWADVNVPGLRKVEGIGPAGWSRAIRSALGLVR